MMDLYSFVGVVAMHGLLVTHGHHGNMSLRAIIALHVMMVMGMSSSLAIMGYLSSATASTSRRIRASLGLT